MGPVCHLADVMGCRGVILSNISQSLHGDFERGKGTYGAVQFEMYGPGADNPLGCVRSVSVAFDGDRWRFDANGSIQPFEDIDCYNKRDVVDRFTPAMLAEYAAALGINAFSERFYAGEACVVTYANAASKPARECALADAQLESGIR
jgi:hypothetical protein